MRRLFWLALLSLVSGLILGCPEEEVTGDDDDTIGTQSEEVWIALEFTLDAESTVAGIAVGYQAELVAESGARKDADVELASDLEAGLDYTEFVVTATWMGTHLITATAWEGDEEFTAEANLAVDPGPLFVLDLTLDTNSTPAGEWVGMAVSGEDAWGNPVDASAAEITADAALELDGMTVRGVVLGSYDVTATVGGMAGDVSDTETLEITAGAPWDVDLTLSDSEIVAGDTATWSALFWDEYDNPIDEADVVFTVSADSGDVLIVDHDIDCTVAGGYVVRIDVDGGSTPWDTEGLDVLAGEPASIDLTLSDPAPEVDDPVTASVVILDMYGNESDAAWSLDVTAEPGTDQASVTVTGYDFTFSDDGWFTATATVDLNGIFDTEGPFLVDSYGPVIDIVNPERGAWRSSYSDTVTGTIEELWSGVASATVDGNAVTVAGDGSFSYPITYDFGTNMIETLAEDGDGNAESDRRAVLAGSFVAEGSGVGNGLVVRVNEGGLNTLETIGEDLIDNTDVAGMIPSPVYYGWAEDCWDPCGGWFGGCEICVTWYELTLNVMNPSLGASDLELDPRSGYLHADGTVHDIWVDWSASGSVVGIGYSASGSISADSMTIGMDITPSISGGNIQTSVSSVTVTSNNFDFDFDSWIYDVATFFGIDIDGMVQDEVEAAIRDAVQDEIPPLLEDTFQDLEIATDFDFEGVTYDFTAEPYSVSVDNDGLSLGLETYLTAGTWNSPYLGLGSLHYGYSLPAYGSTPGMVASISGDFLNQALLAFWGGGLLDQTFTAVDLGVDPQDLAFLGKMSDPHILIEALLPPVVLPGTNGHMLDLQAGDLQVSIYGDDPSDPANLMFIMYIGLDAGLELAVTQNATLEATISDVETWFDLTYPVMPNSLAVDMEDLLDLIVPGLTPLLTDAIGEISIPEFDGFSLTVTTLEAAGAEYGYVNAGGDLVVN